MLCPSYVDTKIYDSGRNRQRRFGGAFDVAADDERNPLRGTIPLIRSGMAPELVARRVVEAVRNDELYVFTNPEMRVVVEDRFARIDKGFDRAEASPVLKGSGRVDDPPGGR